MQNNLCVLSLILLLLLSMQGSVHAQVQQQRRTLVVNGQVGEALVLQIEGRAFVDVETLARIVNGTLGFQGSRIVLTLPASASMPTTAPTPSPADNSAFSREFVKAAIEDISLMREWASTLANAIQNGYPITGNWVAVSQARAAQGLQLASASASTDGDRSGLQLLSNEFDAVRKWSNKLVNARESMDAANYAMSARALQDDPLSQKILSCGRFLGSMLGSGNFQDDPSCH